MGLGPTQIEDEINSKRFRRHGVGTGGVRNEHFHRISAVVFAPLMYLFIAGFWKVAGKPVYVRSHLFLFQHFNHLGLIG